PVRPALDRVLHLEPELGREAAEVDPRPAAQHAVLGELAGIGGTQLPPPGVVGLAELVGLVLGPERAERQQALRPRLRRGRLGPRGHQASSCPKTVAVRRTVTPPLRSAARSRDIPPPGCSRHSPSPSACRQAAKACRTCRAGASPLTWPMSTELAGPTVQA